jgi:hypothetical protein
MRATSTLLLAAQLLALGHLVVVRHGVCFEHGEAVHLGSPREAQVVNSTPERATTHPVLDGPAQSAEGAHDHCLARANTRERFALLPDLDSRPAPLLLAAPLPSLSAVGTVSAVAVILLAPKNSPPWA